MIKPASAATYLAVFPKLFWIIAGTLFAAASLVVIHYEVEIGVPKRTGSVNELGRLKVSEPAPDFTLRDLAGQSVTLSSFQGKKAVLIDFWATWCAPCVAAMPGLQDLSGKFKHRDFDVVAINQGESIDQVRHFIEGKNYSLHFLLDQDRTVGDKYGLQGIPTSVLVDKNGVVQAIFIGNRSDEDELQKRVERIVKK